MLKNTIAILIGSAFALSTLAIPKNITQAEQQTPPIKVEAPAVSHQQEVWINALEWCESRGINEAVNPKDKDGTPSYYAFQFKPGTFKGYGEQYGIIEKGLSQQKIMELIKTYDLQKKIVIAMVKDWAKIDWQSQFPACVRKLGMPPKK